MGPFVAGDVVVCTFPFSDLSNSKRRPALVISGPFGNDYTLCMITSTNASLSVKLDNSNFERGSLRNVTSYVRPEKIFTSDKSIIVKKVGKVQDAYMQLVKAEIKSIHNL